jgi:hypothetical protein
MAILQWAVEFDLGGEVRHGMIQAEGRGLDGDPHAASQCLLAGTVLLGLVYIDLTKFNLCWSWFWPDFRRDLVQSLVEIRSPGSIPLRVSSAPHADRLSHVRSIEGRSRDKSLSSRHRRVYV